MELAIFIVCAGIILTGALGVITSRNPVHAALSLVGTLFGVAVLFLNQNAQLLAAVQVIVYTGAIVVLILFVIMLIGVDKEEDIETEPLLGQRMVAGVLGIAFIGLLLGIFVFAQDAFVTGQPNCMEPAPISVGSPFEESCKAIDANKAVSGSASNVAQIGRILFTDHIFAFEATALLLTIAVVGAVLLSRKPKSFSPLPEVDPLPISKRKRLYNQDLDEFDDEDSEDVPHVPMTVVGMDDQ